MSLLTNVLKLWRTGQYLLPADSGFMVKHLFANGEPGFAKLDFSGFAGMYQDRARTIPYTAVEQPLGSFTGLNGVIATAPADANRGVVSARVNLLPSNDLGSWTKTAGVMMSVASVGDVHTGSNVFKLTYDGSGGAGSYRAYVDALPFIVSAPNATYSTSIYLRADVPFTARISGNAVAGPLTTVNVTTAWQKVSITGVGNGAGVPQAIIYSAAGDNAPFELYISSTDIRLATDAHLPYQRVNTATDYDTAGFPHYLTFNGTNTAYVTPSIDFSGTDKMTVWAGVTRLTQEQSVVCELSNTVTNNGMFYSGISSGNYASFISRGTGGDYPNAYAPLAPPPVSAVIGGSGSIGDQISTARVNGVSINSNLNQGTGNYGNYPLYIGTRGGTALFFNGRIYNLIVRGAATPLPQIESVETLIRKTMRLP